jgi:predicted TIM-barrel fold metal-dependent hydrolase
MSTMQVPTGSIDSDAAPAKLYGSLGVGDPSEPLTLLPDPPARQAWCPIISADDHVLEPPTLFTDRVPVSMADRAPHIEEVNGRPYWVIDGDKIHITGSNGAVGRPIRQLMQLSLRFDEMRPGVLDVHDRIRDMDLNGVWASLCFPALPFGFAGKRLARMHDPDVGLACVRAYNDWVIDEWCGAYPDRFISCQLPWLADPVIAADEIRRNAERGFRTVSFSENPEALGFASLYSGAWDPFFRACEETETVVSLHVGSSGVLHQPSADSPIFAVVALFPLNGVTALVDWIFAKIPIRFPNLKIVLSEAGVSWVPMAIERLNRAFRQREATDYWRPDDPHPVDLVKRNFWFTSIEDPSAFRNLDVIGVDRVMVEADYPHADSSWPDTQDLLRRDLAHLSTDEIRRVCYQNAAEVYRCPEPPAAVLRASVLGEVTAAS